MTSLALELLRECVTFVMHMCTHTYTHKWVSTYAYKREQWLQILWLFQNVHLTSLLEAENRCYSLAYGFLSAPSFLHCSDSETHIRHTQEFAHVSVRPRAGPVKSAHLGGSLGARGERGTAASVFKAPRRFQWASKVEDTALLCKPPRVGSMSGLSFCPQST